MESTKKELFLIIDRFQKYAEQINGLYMSDPHFKDLCSDYLLCLTMLEKYRNESVGQPDTIKEYELVRKDLEKEMKDFIFNRK